MFNEKIQKLAELIVNYSVQVKKNDKVIIAGSTASEVLIREIYKAVLSKGGHPRVQMEFIDQQYHFHKLAQDHQLEYTDPFALYEAENVDKYIGILPDLNPHQLTSIDADKKTKVAIAKQPIMETFFKRWGQGSLLWVGTACPTNALAQEAKLSLDEYSNFLFNSINLNEEDPVAYWKQFSDNQQKICDKLNKVKMMRYVGLDTDLSFRCDGRTWINCDGKVNLPDGEVFTGPIEDSVEGKIRFTYPGIYKGEEIEDIFLRFEKGKVVKASASKGEKLLHRVLDTDEGARYVGEIAIGTNYNINKFTKNILFDEKIGGTVHLALGRAIPQTGSNNISAIHWDMLKNMEDGGEIYADGKLIYKNGNFLPEF